jgi:hypothetical protein
MHKSKPTWEYTHIILAEGRLRQEAHEFQPNLGYKPHFFSKKRVGEAGGVAQAVKYLPCKCRALSSSPQFYSPPPLTHTKDSTAVKDECDSSTAPWLSLLGS